MDQSSVPHGYCHCGCGQKTAIAPYSVTSRGWVKGEPKRFLSGHNKRILKAAIVCAHCGTTFYVIPAHADRAKFCSRDCSHDAERQKAQRRVDNDYAVDPDTGCWIWNHCKSRDEYAKISRNKESKAVYGIKWEQENSPQPPGTTLHHLCETPACVRPSHLQLLSRRDHASVHHAALTDADKQEIRRLRYEVGMAAKDIAKLYDVDPSVISRNAPTDANERKLSDEMVHEVRRRLAAGETHTTIRKHTGVSMSLISHIRNGKSYGDV